jgi:cyanophycinase-like exopeptidase
MSSLAKRKQFKVDGKLGKVVNNGAVQAGALAAAVVSVPAAVFGTAYGTARLFDKRGDEPNAVLYSKRGLDDADDDADEHMSSLAKRKMPFMPGGKMSRLAHNKDAQAAAFAVTATGLTLGGAYAGAQIIGKAIENLNKRGDEPNAALYSKRGLDDADDDADDDEAQEHMSSLAKRMGKPFKDDMATAALGVGGLLTLPAAYVTLLLAG